MKKIGSICFIIVLLFSFAVNTFAAEMILYADATFQVASASLSSTKKVTFDVTTGSQCGVLKISSCQLEQKVNGEWKSAGSLTAPSDTSKNSCSLMTSADYSTKIGTGTFRIKVGFTADSYTIYRYSNEKTYK